MPASAQIQITPEVHAVLVASTCIGSSLTLPAQLDRKLYLAVNKVLELLGGKWDRHKKAHLFTEDPAVLVAEALENGAVTDKVKAFQFYRTPDDLARRMVAEGIALLKLRGHSGAVWALEPSAGDGAIVKHLLDAPQIDRVRWCELEEGRFEKLLSEFKDAAPSARNFLDHWPNGNPDLIVMNPPFTRGQDVDHLAHALDIVNPTHGVVVAVMSAGLVFKSDSRTKAMRDRLAELNATIKPLPPGTFKDSGTMVNAVLVVV